MAEQVGDLLNPSAAGPAERGPVLDGVVAGVQQPVLDLAKQPRPVVELFDADRGVTVAVGIDGDHWRVHRPKSFQASVPACKLWSSLARAVCRAPPAVR